MGMDMCRNNAKNKKFVITSDLGGLCACLYLHLYEKVIKQVLKGNGDKL